MEITALQPHELDEAVNLAALCMGEDLRPYAILDFKYTFEKASYTPKTFVAKKDGRIVGVIQSFNAYMASNLCGLGWVATSPDYRRQGIASALIAQAEQDAIETLFKGKDGTFILHSSTNPDYYRSSGYESGSLTTVDGHPFMVKHYKTGN